MASPRSSSPPHWFVRMRAAFDAALYSEAIRIFDEARERGETLPNDALLLHARTLLKRDERRAANALLKMRLTRPTPMQSALRDLYLGIAYARLHDFAEADARFAAARPAFRGAKERAEFASHVARRHLLAGEVPAARACYEETLADRSPSGKIRSTHLHSYICARSGAYAEQARDVVAVLDLIGEERLDYAEDWYVAVHTLCVLARELSSPELAVRGQREVDRDVAWPPDFGVQRFQALKAIAWCRALRGDQLACLRYLRLAQAAAPSDAWRAVLFLDRAFFALVMNERRWAENEFALAQDLADAIDWESTGGEERVALLLLAELAAVLEPSRGRYYLARYDDLHRMKSALHQIAFDDRLPAMRAFAGGMLAMAGGDAAEAEARLREAWRIFDAAGYDVRAGRAAAALHHVTGKERWRHLAEDKFEGYPDAWFARQAFGNAPAPPGPPLTPMQATIVRMVRRGLSTDEIAAELSRSRNTVLNHLKLIYKKLGVKSRESLLAEAIRRGLVS